MTLSDDIDRLEEILAYQIAVDRDSQEALDKAAGRVEGAHVITGARMVDDGFAHWVACKCGDVLYDHDTERLAKKYSHHVSGTALNQTRKERL